jgi:23S rRNA (uracil1939-C5)-methyltransferase
VCLDPGVELELTPDRLAYGGQAVARVEGLAVFVDQALPGQRLRVQITRRHRRHLEARILAVLQESPHYTPPFCRHFGVCGGCRWQHLSYAEQVRWKGRHLKECLRHLGKVAPREFLDPVSSPRERHYRNKMTFAGAPGGPAEGGLILGLHRHDAPGEIFPVAECHLLSPGAMTLILETRDLCRRLGLTAYDRRTGQGVVHAVVVREGKRTGQKLLHLLTAGQARPQVIARLAEELRRLAPGLTTLAHSHYPGRPRPQPPPGRILAGPGYLEEELASVRLRVSPESFLQPNPEAAELLYEAIRERGEFTGREVVWDLYCGAGGIALALAPRVRQVVGFELSAVAVADARTNARLNRRDNCRFVAGDLARTLRAALADPSFPRPEVVVADPPRAGLDSAVSDLLTRLAPRRLLLVSCHPATLARDLARLSGAFEVETAQAFDFFPHTPHLEALATLRRRRGGG